MADAAQTEDTATATPVVAPAIEPVEPGDEFSEIDDALASLTNVDGTVTANPDPFTLKEQNESESANTTEQSNDGDASGSTEDAGGQQAAGEEGAVTTGEEEAAATESTSQLAETDTAGVFQETAEDPGEFTPGDHSFEITLKDGKTRKITSPEEAEALAVEIDENPELITAKTFIDFNRKFMQMDTAIANDQRDFETKKEAFDVSQATKKVRTDTVNQINNGLSYLQSKGLIPEVPAALNTAEAGTKWETDHKDEPGVKERLAILKYMTEENERRMAAGLDPSFDVPSAFNAIRLEEMQNTAEDTTKQQAKTRKQRGAMVGSNAPSIQSNESKGTIVGEGGSLADLMAEAYNDM